MSNLLSPSPSFSLNLQINPPFSQLYHTDNDEIGKKEKDQNISKLIYF